MNWKLLKDSKCPKCESKIQEAHLGEPSCMTSAGYYECIACDFKIGKAKFEEVINNLYKPKQFRSETDNLSDLNNLGRKEITEDFSDSGFLTD